MSRRPVRRAARPPPPDPDPNPPRPDEPVARECVEGYLCTPRPRRLWIFRRFPDRGSIWVPISGKVEPADRSNRSALRRELAEETGLAAPVPVRSLRWTVRFRAENGAVWRLHAYWVLVPSAWRPRLSSEHRRAEAVSLAEARRRLYFADNRRAVDRLRRSFVSRARKR